MKGIVTIVRVARSIRSVIFDGSEEHVRTLNLRISVPLESTEAGELPVLVDVLVRVGLRCISSTYVVFNSIARVRDQRFFEI